MNKYNYILTCKFNTDAELSEDNSDEIESVVRDELMLRTVEDEDENEITIWVEDVTLEDR